MIIQEHIARTPKCTDLLNYMPFTKWLEFNIRRGTQKMPNCRNKWVSLPICHWTQDSKLKVSQCYNCSVNPASCSPSAPRARLSLRRSRFIKSKLFPHRSFRKKQTQQQQKPNLNNLYCISDSEGIFPAARFTRIILSILFSFPNQKLNLTSFRELFHSLINFFVKVCSPLL